MGSTAKRLIGPGIAYLFFGAFMLYMGLSAWGIIPSGDIPSSRFMAVVSTAIGILDLVIGTRKLFSWGGACPSCGFSKVSIFRDETSTSCRSCKRKIVRKESFFFLAH
jgi:hypothetical protein